LPNQDIALYSCRASSKIIYHGDTEDTEFLVSIGFSP
jgi:hypothetical protein